MMHNPSHPLAGYSGTPLVQKLGIKPGSTLALVSAPVNFRRELVGLPRTVRVRPKVDDGADLIVWFVRARGELETRVANVAAVGAQGVWIAWPKKASGVKTDLNEDLVRAAGLAHGLVDYKVCAINDVWSGLKFAKRKGRTSA